MSSYQWKFLLRIENSLNKKVLNCPSNSCILIVFSAATFMAALGGVTSEGTAPSASAEDHCCLNRSRTLHQGDLCPLSLLYWRRHHWSHSGSQPHSGGLSHWRHWSRHDPHSHPGHLGRLTSHSALQHHSCLSTQLCQHHLQAVLTTYGSRNRNKIFTKFYKKINTLNIILLDNYSCQ